MDVEIEQDDLNQKFLTSLTPEWLMYTIMLRNKGDLDTMSLDDLYNHLKVYEPEVQKKLESNSHNMAFISTAKNSSGNGEVNTASVPTASNQVSPASANVATASISLDTTCAYIASQSNGSQIKNEDINQIDEDDIEEMDIKPSPSVESNPNDLQNNSSSVSEIGESTGNILSKPKIKFVKATDIPTVIKTNKDETVRKTSVKYAEMYKKTSKRSNVRGNQRNWNNMKSQQLGKNFLMNNKACYNYGCFDHLSYDCGKWVDQGKTREKNNYTHKSRSP
nr:ribonuclease H-like domain-containing protein [Tanacetum cinerariifolium]